MIIVEGTLAKIKNIFYLVTPEGNYGIHSVVDVPKVSSLPDGTLIHGQIFGYTPKQRSLNNWPDKIDMIETGCLRVGAMPGVHP